MDFKIKFRSEFTAIERQFCLQLSKNAIFMSSELGMLGGCIFGGKVCLSPIALFNLIISTVFSSNYLLHLIVAFATRNFFWEIRANVMFMGLDANKNF